MKRYLASSLLAVALLPSCIIVDDDPSGTEVLATWSLLLHNDETGQSAAASCPAGFEARVASLPVGAPVTDTAYVVYDCAAGQGLSIRESGLVDVWVEIVDPANSQNIYARSVTAQVNADVAAPTAPPFSIQLEHGFYDFNWALFQTVSNAPVAVTCAELETDFVDYDSLAVGGTFTSTGGASEWGRWQAYECSEGAQGAIFYSEPAPVASVTELQVSVVDAAKLRIAEGGCMRSSDNWDLALEYGNEYKQLGITLLQVSLDPLDPNSPNECYYNLP